jgi:transposase InsO family protein
VAVSLILGTDSKLCVAAPECSRLADGIPSRETRGSHQRGPGRGPRREARKRLRYFSSRRRRPWKNIEEVEFATLEWVDWFNHQRLLEPIGDIPPAEFEKMYYARMESSAMEAGLN